MDDQVDQVSIQTPPVTDKPTVAVGDFDVSMSKAAALEPRPQITQNIAPSVSTVIIQPTPTVSNINTSTPVSPKVVKKKSKHYCSFGCLGIILIIIGYFWVWPVYHKWQSSKRYSTSSKSFTSEAIKGDYKSGKLTKDGYLKQLLYSSYDRAKLDLKYRDSDKDINSVDIFTDFLDDTGISAETKKEVVKYIFRTDIAVRADKTFDSSGKVISDNAINDIPLTDSAIAAAPGFEKNTLNERIFTSSGKFVIWFTETGPSKVDKKYALKAAADIDKIYANYVNKLSLSNNIVFKYLGENNMSSQSRIFQESKGKIPVYILNDDYESDVAHYMTSTMPDWIIALFPVMNKDGFESSLLGHQILPYIQMKPKYAENYDELRAIISHELVHLAQDVNCKWDFWCHMAGPESKFSSETTANWIAAEENPEANIFKKYHLSKYFSTTSPKCGVSMSIDKNSGYCTYTFLEFLSMSVDTKTIFDSHKEKLTMSYIKSKVSNFSKVVSDYSIMNITNSYSSKSFNSTTLPSPVDQKIVSGDKTIDPVSMNYYYAKVSDLKDSTIKISSGANKEELYLSVMARKTPLANFVVNQNTGYNKVYQERLSGDFVFVPGNYKDYDEIAIIFSNGSLENYGHYTIEKISNEVGAITAIEQSSDCKKVGTYNSIFDYFSQLPTIFSEFNKGMADLNDDGTVIVEVNGQGGETASNALRDSASELDRLSEQLKSTGIKQGNKGIIACVYPIKVSSDEKSAHKEIFIKYKGFKSSILDYAAPDEEDPGTHYSLFSNYSLKGGLSFINVITNYTKKDQMKDPKTGKEYMGALIELKFEKLNN